MDISPIDSIYSNDVALHRYNVLSFEYTGTPGTILTGNPGLYTPPFPIVNYNFIIPNYQYESFANAFLRFYAKLSLRCIGTAGTENYFPAKIARIGDLNISGEFKINGVSAPDVTGDNLTYSLSKNPGQIIIPELLVDAQFDTNQLTPNASFTPDPTSASWQFLLRIMPVITFYKVMHKWPI